MCKQVLEAVRSCPSGLTCEQVEQLLGMKHQTASARLRDLMCLEPCPLEFRLMRRQASPNVGATPPAEPPAFTSQND